MGATVPGLKYGLAIHHFLMDVEPENTEEVKKIHLRGDNLATVTTLLHQVTSWRTRHYAVKAAWARDMIHLVGIDVKHTPGEFLVAGILTKVLKGERLRELSSKLCLRPIQTSTLEHQCETTRGCFDVGKEMVERDAMDNGPDCKGEELVGGDRSKEECEA